MPLDEIKKYQLNKLRNLLKVAMNAPYYREIISSFDKSIDEFTLEDLKNFPILTKDIIRREKFRLLSKPIKELFPNSSGGSTGEPIIFIKIKMIENKSGQHQWL